METLKKFPRMRKKEASRNIFWHFPRATVFFMFVSLISNYTVFFVQIEIHLNLWGFQKVEVALAEAARAIEKLTRAN